MSCGAFCARLYYSETKQTEVVARYIYSSAVLEYSSEVLVLYLNISASLY